MSDDKLIQLTPKQKARLEKLDNDIKRIHLKLGEAAKVGLDTSAFKPSLEQLQRLSLGIKKLVD